MGNTMNWIKSQSLFVLSDDGPFYLHYPYTYHKSYKKIYDKNNYPLKIILRLTAPGSGFIVRTRHFQSIARMIGSDDWGLYGDW